MLTSKPVRLHGLLLVCALVLAACGGSPSTPTPATPATPTAAPAAPTLAPTTSATVQATSAAVLPTAAQPAPTVTPEPNPSSDPITGKPGLARGTVKQRLMVVMIDNHPDAYPQTGLSHAVVVFEALAEFGVTRFMAVLDPASTHDVPKIGPVRSTRLYFAQWAIGFHALYAHAGGSPQGLELVESTDQLINLDALRKDGGAYFSRSKDRVAPHNLYTSAADLAQAAGDRGASEFADPKIGFLFKTDAPAPERPQAQELGYYFIYSDDDAGWTYDPKTNGYYRLRRGKPARDAETNEQLWAKNVVVMEVREARIAGDPKGRIEQDVVGSGTARVFFDGAERTVTWRKDSAEAQLGFFDDSGAEVRFNAGPIWIVVVPDIGNLTVK